MQPKVQTAHFDLDKIILTWKTVLYNLFLITAGIIVFVIKQVNRGVTFLQAQGVYTGSPREVIFTITTLTELPKLKNVIFNIDPEAFVVVNSTLEVIGKRHGTRKVY